MRRLPLLLVPLLLATGCTGDAAPGDDVPSAESFADGTCSTVAEDVRTIGRLLPEIGDGPSVDPEVLDTLRTSQEGLRSVAEGAEPELQGTLQELSRSVGFIRIRGVGNTYEPFIGEQAQQAYDRVVDACTEN
jgi:hypothetical protein